MNLIKRIGGINLIILLVYTAIAGIIGLNESGQYKGLGTMIFMAFAVGVHTGILLLIALIRFIGKDNAAGRAYLLSSLLILLVGFSACFGVATLIGG
jgi:hypothetical protein